MLKFSFELRFYVILTYIIRLVMHIRGKISKNDENPSKNDKKLQNGPKNYLDMLNQVGLEYISNNVDVIFLLNTTYYTNGVLIGPQRRWIQWNWNENVDIQQYWKLSHRIICLDTIAVIFPKFWTPCMTYVYHKWIKDGTFQALTTLKDK